MFIWVFNGNLGSGKTFGMSLFAHYFKARAKRHGIETNLFANYALADSKRITNHKAFFDVARSESSIVCVDEAHINLDSRLFSRGKNVYLTQFLMYMRKLRCSFFFASPTIYNIDSRIRNLTNIMVDCQKWRKGFHWEIWDFQRQRRIRTFYMPTWKAKKIIDLGLYDSYEMIYAIDFPSTESGFKDFIIELTTINEEASSTKANRKIKSKLHNTKGVVTAGEEIRGESIPVLLPQST